MYRHTFQWDNIRIMIIAIIIPVNSMWVCLLTYETIKIKLNPIIVRNRSIKVRYCMLIIKNVLPDNHQYKDACFKPYFIEAITID